MKSHLIVCLGFSLCLLFGVFTLWGGLPLASLTGFDISDILKYWSTPLSLSLGLALFSVLLIRKPLNKVFLTGLSVASGLLILGGFVFLLIAGSFPPRGVIFIVISAICIGLGNGLLLLVWQHRISCFEDADITKLLLASLVASSVGYLMLIPLPESITSIVPPAIALLSILLYLFSRRLCQEDEEDTPRRENMLGSIFREIRDLLFCVSAIAVAVALTRFIALDSLEDPNIVNISSSVMVIVVALVLYALWFSTGKRKPSFSRQNILWLYRIFFPIIATALVALSIFGNMLALQVTTLVYVAFSVVSVFIMSTSISLAREHKLRSFHVYGLFAGCMYFVFMIATTLGPWVYYPKNFGTATLPIIVMLVLYILAMSYVAIQNRKRKGSDESPAEDNEAVASPTVVDEVAQRCSILAQQKSLTNREHEVLLLIARGRDVPSIAKQLFISENTVRTHSKNVYKKLDIHSKQELLDLMEGVPEEELRPPH